MLYKKKERDPLADYFDLRQIPYEDDWVTPYGNVSLSKEFGDFMSKLHLEAMTMDHAENKNKTPVEFYKISEAIDTIAAASLKSGVELTNIFKD